MELTELMYSDARDGLFKLYIYDTFINGEAYHRGGVWFRREPQDAEEISAGEAMITALEAELRGCEVHICDSGDMLVYHFKDGKVLWPSPVGNFWTELCNKKEEET